MTPRVVFGLGDPVTDVLCRLSRSCACEILSGTRGGSEPSASHAPVEIGGCVVVTGDILTNIVRALPTDDVSTTPGGSAANVLKGLAALDANATCALIGTIADDDVGRAYALALSRDGVSSASLTTRSRSGEDESSAGELTSARCVCLVDENGQRTMRTSLGASATTTVDDLPIEELRRADVLHAEGYALYRPDVLRRACEVAKTNGALVSLDLASFEVVRGCRAALREILESGMIDVVFCNEDEARELVSVSGIVENGRDVERPDAETETAALEWLLRHVKVATCSRGKRGCVSMNAEGARAESLAEGVVAIDTTGAGDTFTSGFLYAYLVGGSLQQCSDAGCAAGAEVVQIRGAAMDVDRWNRVREKVATILSE